MPIRIFFWLPAFLAMVCCSSARTGKGPTPGPEIARAAVDSLPVKNPEKQGIMYSYPDYGILREILDTEQGPFREVFAKPDSVNLQIVYTQIDRDRNGKPSFRDYRFVPSPGRYVYPASTVKMPVAFLALQRLRELDKPGLDMESTMITEAAGPGQTPVYNDPSTPDGRPTIAQYVRKIFLVSDNDAYNRLYEFLGPQYINHNLQRMGYSEAEITHRLELALDENQNRSTNPLRFLDRGGRTIYTQPAQFDSSVRQGRQEFIGRGYLAGGELVEKPMDFSRKNRISLESLHNILKSVIFPESVPVKQRFFLSPQDYRFLYRYMSATPSSVGYPPYDSTDYYDTYCKFLLFGSEKHQKIPAGMKVFNKVGDAYGHLLDVAYVADAANGVEFLLSVVVYVNSDGILNDNRYEYDTLGFPLLKYIGERIYFYERNRPKAYKPNLDWTKTID
jgi:hypothetical protein